MSKNLSVLCGCIFVLMGMFATSCKNPEKTLDEAHRAIKRDDFRTYQDLFARGTWVSGDYFGTPEGFETLRKLLNEIDKVELSEPVILQKNTQPERFAVSTEYKLFLTSKDKEGSQVTLAEVVVSEKQLRKGVASTEEKEEGTFIQSVKLSPSAFRNLKKINLEQFNIPTENLLPSSTWSWRMPLGQTFSLSFENAPLSDEVRGVVAQLQNSEGDLVKAEAQTQSEGVSYAFAKRLLVAFDMKSGQVIWARVFEEDSPLRSLRIRPWSEDDVLWLDLGKVVYVLSRGSGELVQKIESLR